MMRDSLAADAAHVSAVVQGNRIRLLDRASTGGNTTDALGHNQGAPEWIRIERSGNTFTLSRSNDGSSWTVMDTRTISMGTMIYIGMAVTGNSTTTLATGVFDNVATTGSGATPTPTATNTPLPTNTPTATHTPVPTNTPTPTNTPPPSPTPAPDVWIKRSSYSIAGQMVAFRVTGDPANSGLFYMLSDHLGSTSLLVNSSGGTVTGSTTRYLPFGGYRGTAPSQTITDRDFTGQKENMELGLLYYQARFYVPGIGRFASADSLVPDPANPQAYNRYSYVENRPLNFNDPTGHCSFDPQSPHEYYSCLEQASNASIESGISFDYLSQFDWGSLSGEEIREIWFYFVLQEQGSLLKAYGTREDGSSKVKFANFAKGNSVSPSTEKELVAMMGTGRRAVEAVIENISSDEIKSIEFSCNSLVGAYFGLQNDIHHSMGNNQGYTSNFNFSGNLSQDINANVVLFTNSPTQNGRPLHGAVMASPNYDNQENSIILQVDGSLPSSGLFFTTVGNNQNYGPPFRTPYYLYSNP